MSTFPAPLRVLVVEDYRDAADSLALLLHAWGHQVWIVHDGPSALELAAEHFPNVVLLDIALPGMDGYEVARRLRQRDWPVRPFLVSLSGLGEEVRRRALEAGCDLHLSKPIDPEQLRRLLWSASGGRFPARTP